MKKTLLIMLVIGLLQASAFAGGKVVSGKQADIYEKGPQEIVTEGKADTINAKFLLEKIGTQGKLIDELKKELVKAKGSRQYYKSKSEKLSEKPPKVVERIVVKDVPVTEPDWLWVAGAFVLGLLF